jgi:hypothetical protein
LEELHTFVPATFILRKRCCDERVTAFKVAYDQHVAAAAAAAGGEEARGGASGPGAPAKGPVHTHPNDHARNSRRVRDDLAPRARPFHVFNTFLLHTTSAGTVWILKPGKNSNRGSGIEVADSYEDVLRLLRIPHPSAPVGSPAGHSMPKEGPVTTVVAPARYVFEACALFVVSLQYNPQTSRWDRIPQLHGTKAWYKLHGGGVLGMVGLLEIVQRGQCD